MTRIQNMSRPKFAEITITTNEDKCKITCVGANRHLQGMPIIILKSLDTIFCFYYQKYVSFSWDLSTYYH